MPGRDGISLLEEVAKRFPQTHRILCTGQPEMEFAERAVNEAWVHQLYEASQ